MNSLGPFWNCEGEGNDIVARAECLQDGDGRNCPSGDDGVSCLRSTHSVQHRLKNLILGRNSLFKDSALQIAKTYGKEIVAEFEWFDNGDTVFCGARNFEVELVC